MQPVRSLILFILLSLFSADSAQTLHPLKEANLRFRNIGLEQGLSQSTVYAVAQDSRGFMWFGTQDGLNRFDGYSMKVFKHIPGDRNSVADNSISCLEGGRDDNLWIGTFKGGLDRYSVTENKFYHYAHSDSTPGSINADRINILFKDTQGETWIGTNKGLDHFKNQSDNFEHISFITKTGIKKTIAVNALSEDDDGNLWIGTNQGLFKLDHSSSLKALQVKIGSDNAGTYIISTVYADKGILWIGSEENSLQSYDTKTGKVTGFPESPKGIRPLIEESDGILWYGSLYSSGLNALNLKTRESFGISSVQNDLVIALYKDSNGIIWAGTFFHGVFLFDKQNNRFTNYLNDPQNPNVVMSVIQDYRGGFWAGTFGNGLKYINGENNSVISYVNIPGDGNSLSSNRILSLAEDPNHNIWVGTVSGGLDCFDPRTDSFTRYIYNPHSAGSKVASNDVTALYNDTKGNLWIGHYLGAIDIYNYSSRTFTHLTPPAGDSIMNNGSTVTIFREDKNGRVWIGTHGSGLLSYMPASGKFTGYELVKDTSTKRQNLKERIDISTLYTADDGIVWVGSDKNGIIRFDPSSGTTKSFKIKNSKPDNVIYGMLPDNSGCLWLSTNNGLTRFDPGTGSFKNFDKNDGLQSNEFNQGAYFKNSKGELFFGGVNGFNVFSPDEIKDNGIIPPVYFTSFKVFDKPLPDIDSVLLTKKIELSYSQNFFSFEFVALSYTVPEKNLYAYMLEDFDKDWHYVSSHQRYASYTNLDPGKYTLRVKGSNNDGVWNEEGASIELIINPPFWMTWWFRIAAILFVAALFYAVYRYRIIQILKMERMRFRIANDLHDELGSDLSAIALASQMTRGQDTNDQGRLNKIRENALRAIDSMREIVWFIKPEHDSPEKLLARIKEVTETMLEGKSYTIEQGTNFLKYFQDIESRQNLFLIYKECLTNIVRHSGCTEVKIVFGNGSDKKLLSIYDNGTGFDIEKAKKGSGLNNLQARAMRIKATIKIKSESGKGTLIELFPEK